MCVEIEHSSCSLRVHTETRHDKIISWPQESCHSYSSLIKTMVILTSRIVSLKLGIVLFSGVPSDGQRRAQQNICNN